MRTYGDPCGIARALDLVGERWALLVVRELLLGPKRFTDLRAGLPGASPNVLAQRLRELERAGVVRRRKLGPPAGARVYELTDWGRELEPVVLGLGRWGSRSTAMPPTELSVDALILALKSLFDPGAAGRMSVTVEVRLGDDTFTATVANGRLDLTRGPAAAPGAVLTTDVPTLRSLAFARTPLADARHANRLGIEGDEGAAARFLTLFPRPAPAPVPA